MREMDDFDKHLAEIFPTAEERAGAQQLGSPVLGERHETVLTGA